MLHFVTFTLKIPLNLLIPYPNTSMQNKPNQKAKVYANKNSATARHSQNGKASMLFRSFGILFINFLTIHLCQ